MTFKYKNVDKDGIVVFKRDNEDFEFLLKRFKKKVTQSGILKEVRMKEFFEKPSVRKKRKYNEAKVRARKDQIKLEKSKRRIQKNEKNTSDK